jgi:cell wall-associated NlpC family hydrolase
MYDAAEFEPPEVLGSLTRDALKVLAPLATLIFGPLLLLVAAFGGLPDATRTTGLQAQLDAIPPEHLAVMQRVGQQTGVPWQVLAAIAKVESDFGRNSTASSAGAVGYCQFLPSTWAAYGVDGNADGVADPADFHDCIPAAAQHLVANGAPGDLRAALYAYNHSWAYVDKVLAYASAYGYAHPTSIPAQAVTLARSAVGAPYVWGASGPDTFDCSGLVVWVYSQLGVSTPRTAQQQYDWAMPVEVTQLQPGDLVFYENTYESPDRITHVGIYQGGSTVVMATNSGDFVRVIELTDPYWSAHFVSAGRPPYWEIAV